MMTYITRLPSPTRAFLKEGKIFNKVKKKKEEGTFFLEVLAQKHHIFMADSFSWALITDILQFFFFISLMKFSYTNCEKNFPNCIYLTYKKTSEKKDLPLQLLVRSQLHKKERGGKMLVLYFFRFAISDSVKYSVIR